MGTQNRRDALEELKTQLEAVSGVTTVVRSYGDLDITNYAEAELPLIEISEPDEDTYTEMVSQRNLMQINAILKIWFVDWNTIIQTSYETLMKNIRDKIGAKFKLENDAIQCRVDSISKVEGELPLWSYTIVLELKYYLNALST